MANLDAGSGGGATPPSDAGRWLVGLIALTAILVVGAEFDGTREISAAFAVLIASSATFLYLPQAVASVQTGRL